MLKTHWTVHFISFLAAACRIFNDQGSNPCPLHSMCGVLTTGLPGKSWTATLKDQTLWDANFISIKLLNTQMYLTFYLFIWYPASLSNPPISSGGFCKDCSVHWKRVPKQEAAPLPTYKEHMCSSEKASGAPDLRPQAEFSAWSLPRQASVAEATRNPNFCSRGLGCQGQWWTLLMLSDQHSLP